MLHSPSDLLRAEVEAITAELVTFRRELHAHPETSRNEFATTARIAGELEALGLTPDPLDVGTGLTVDIDGHDGRLAIALRADIDALPMSDAKDVDYRSTSPGATHACGHDVHTTVLLGVAKVLVSLRGQGKLPTGVRLIFQPSEERIPGGALDVVAEGRLEGINEVYALHCDPKVQVGRIAIKSGAITSACDQYLVKLSGPGGHTSRPQLSADLISALGEIVVQAPLLLSRRIDPRAGASLMWGRVSAGNASNAIPSSGELAGTLRCLDVDGWRQARELVGPIIESLVAPYGIECTITRTVGIPPTVNDLAATTRVRSTAGEFLGDDSVVATHQSLGGEDFSEMLLEVPGAMARLGVRPVGEPTWPDIHQPDFDVDEDCIGIGVRLLAGLVLTA